MQKSEKKCVPVTRVGLDVHPFRELAAEAVDRFRHAAENHGIEIADLDKSPHDLDNPPCQAVVSIGGDGTLLAAVRSAYPSNIPVWGINVGDLGYLTTSTTDEIEAGVGHLAKGEYFIETRTMIEAAVKGKTGGETRLVALNDIVVHRRVPGGGLMILDAELDGRFLATYECDGLIISTPTGSTGYNISAGGSILSPTLPAFIITSICAHSFSARSLVVDDSSILVIRPILKMPGEVAFATADGQEIAELVDCPVRSSKKTTDGCTITVRRAERPAGLVRFDEVFFSDVLRDKLRWAEGTSHNRTDK